MPTPPTLTISINSLVLQLQTRLAETTGVYWDTTELTYYVRQAIREFQVLTGFWRAKIQVPTVANQAFYDLSAADAKLAYTVNDTDILSQVGAQILESDVIPYIITSQFALTALTEALDQRLQELFGETRMVVSEYTPAEGAVANGRITLPSGVLQIHRADWQDGSSGLWTRLERSDEIGGYGWAFNWPSSPSTPQAYSVAVVPPFSLQLIPPPANSGDLDLLLTECDPYIYTGSSQLLGVPDDTTFALPWGILASILSQDSQSRDYQRASYALARWNMALEIFKKYPLVMQVSISLTPQIQPATMQGLDAWNPGWRNLPTAQPTTVAVAGRNLVAMAPIPDAVYNTTMDCIVNSPASGSASTAISVPGDIVSALLDNATHIACFKMGGAEFTATVPMYQNFTKTAEKYASRERAEAINWEALRGVTEYENEQQPYSEETPA